jgi:tyrosyl-tRNA synthetase
MKLAKEIVSIFYNEKKAESAQENWENIFSRKEIPTDIPEIIVKEGTPLVDIFLENKIVSSKGDFRRLVTEGAITNLDIDEKISNPNDIVKTGVYRIGKKRFCKVVIK